MRPERASLLTLVLSIAIVAVIWGLTSQRSRVFGPLPELKPVQSHLRAKDGNVCLYVYNGSFEPASVDICVKIDDEVVVHDLFEHDLMNTFTRYRLRIPRGKHRFTAESERGQATAEQMLDVAGELHVTVAYWYSQGTLFNPESPPCFVIVAEPPPRSRPLY